MIPSKNINKLDQKNALSNHKLAKRSMSLSFYQQLQMLPPMIIVKGHKNQQLKTIEKIRIPDG